MAWIDIGKLSMCWWTDYHDHSASNHTIYVNGHLALLCVQIYVHSQNYVELQKSLSVSFANLLSRLFLSVNMRDKRRLENTVAPKREILIHSDFGLHGQFLSLLSVAPIGD